MSEKNLQKQTLNQQDLVNQPVLAPGKMQEEKKISTGKRVGYFFLSFVPSILCVILQVVALFAALFPRLVIAIASGEIDQTNEQAFMDGYREIVSSCSSMGIFVYHIIGVVVFGLWYYFGFRKPRPTIKETIHKTTRSSVLAAIVCGICLCFFANGTIIVENVLAPGLVENYMEMAEQAGLGVNIFAILATVILAPIGEEFLCRGVTLRFAKKCFSKFWLANILQAFLFAVIHGNLVQGIYAFFIGLVLGYLAEQYQTLAPCIVLHFVVNFSSTTWMDLLFNALFGEEYPNLFTGLVLVILPMVITIAVLLKTKKDNEQKSR